MKKISLVVTILVLLVTLAACSSNESSVDSDTASQVAQTVYDGLSSKERGEIDKDTTKASVTVVTFSQGSGIVYDTSILDQEVYKVSFPWKDEEKAQEDEEGYVVFVSKDDQRIVGYGYAK